MSKSRDKSITINFEHGEVTVVRDDAMETHGIGTPEAFAAISRAWLRSGWDTKYVYSFSWFGRPIIQLPEDLIRIQEVMHQVRPAVIIETGVAHGGSLVFYASLCKAMEYGRVVGIDIDIRAHNRKAIEAHPLSPLITLIEGSSIAPSTIAAVRATLHPDERVLVILDSCHTRDHVSAELEMYSPLVSVGSYIVATDGIMGDLVGAPRSQDDWAWNNPRSAAEQFVQSHSGFRIEEPPFEFNEGLITDRVTYWPAAFIKRIQ